MTTMDVAGKPPTAAELWLSNATFRRVYGAMVKEINPNKDGKIPPGGIAMAAAEVAGELDELALALQRMRRQKVDAEAEVARFKRELRAEKRVTTQLQADLNRGTP